GLVPSVETSLNRGPKSGPKRSLREIEEVLDEGSPDRPHATGAARRADHVRLSRTGAGSRRRTGPPASRSGSVQLVAGAALRAGLVSLRPGHAQLPGRIPLPRRLAGWL